MVFLNIVSATTMYYLQVKTVILFYGISLVRSFFHLRHEDFLLENEQSVYFNLSILRSSPTNWIEQPVDHFNYTDLRTWKQKYFKIMNSWKPEGPILLYLNGEGPLTLSKVGMTYLKDYGGDSQSFIGQLAEETGAAYYLLEHRYYGDSQPLGTSTTENLRFLSSRQALADAAHFLLTLKESPEFKNSKVIVVGGSYAGNLAAWMKLLYPWLVDAVLSSSAPVIAKKDFHEYFETVTDTFRTYGSQECVNKITDKFNTFHALLQSSEGIQKLKEENNICEETKMMVPENQHLFFSSKIFHFARAAQYGTTKNISLICQDFDIFDLEPQFSLFWNDKNGCYDYDFNQWIKNIYDYDILRAWFYQTCTEFGYFQSSSSNKQMFGDAVPVVFYYKMCRMLYGEEFNEKRIDQGVINTNKLYEGLTPNVTNVVFVNGDMDPWHRLGILHDLSADAPAIYIKGVSHCRDIRPDPSDTNCVKEVRKIIKNLLKKWIGQA